VLSARQAAALASAAVVVAAVAFGAFRWWQTPRSAPAVPASATTASTTPVTEPTGGGSAPVLTENPAPSDLQPRLSPGPLPRRRSVPPPAALLPAPPSEPSPAAPTVPVALEPAESDARSETSAASATHERTLSFEKVKLVHQEGGKTKESNVVLELRSDRVALVDPGSRAPMQSMRYESIRAVTYSRSKHPRWKQGIGAAVAVGVLAAPVFFMKGTKHWLTLQATGDYMMLHLDKNNYKSIVAALEARSGRHVATEAGDQ
jgi:hypothetical protein